MKKFAAAMRLSVALVSTLAIAGCAGNPLVARWTATQNSGGINTTVTMTLNADGTSTFGLQPMGGTVSGVTVTCAGAGLTYTGNTWTSTATTLVFAGSPTCSGMSTCTAGGTDTTFDCAAAGTNNFNGSQNYTLSGDNRTLTMTMGSNSFTFTRAN
ncbi:MAG: hypothetical protein Q8Q09_05750 [Deltaproteobacteria bacterium]|nr:hypothetical protein [Deltaproteobacteria bacterium]